MQKEKTSFRDSGELGLLVSNQTTAMLAYWDNTPGNNPLTNDGATLGRVLFYDKILSLNDSKSCGSCHKQQFSFADSSTHSMGFNSGLTRRNTMTITNARWHFGGKMFSDTRGLSMEDAVLMPIQDSVEMGQRIGDSCLRHSRISKCIDEE